MIFIYALVDPLSLDIRYVGQTVNIENRLKHHSKNKANIRRYLWFRYLESKGLQPLVEILDEVDGRYSAFCEEYWIRYYFDLGFDLFNLTEGGECGNPENSREKLKEKISNAWKNPIIRERFQKGQKGCKKPKRTKEHQRKLDESRKKSIPDRAIIEEMYCSRHKGREFLASYFGVDPKTVSNWLIHYDIPIRNLREQAKYTGINRKANS